MPKVEYKTWRWWGSLSCEGIKSKLCSSPQQDNGAKRKTRRKERSQKKMKSEVLKEVVEERREEKVFALEGGGVKGRGSELFRLASNTTVRQVCGCKRDVLHFHSKKYNRNSITIPFLDPSMSPKCHRVHHQGSYTQNSSNACSELHWWCEKYAAGYKATKGKLAVTKVSLLLLYSLTRLGPSYLSELLTGVLLIDRYSQLIRYFWYQEADDSRGDWAFSLFELGPRQHFTSLIPHF